MLLYYSQRILTYQSDALNAMAGIIRRLSHRMKCRFLEGLPTAAFDLFLLFKSHRSILRRREGFPSYSWLGWRGPLKMIDVHADHNKWLQQNTWIVWYKRSPSGVINLVWDPLANDSFPWHDHSYVGYRDRYRFQVPVALPFPTIRTQPRDDPNIAVAAHTYPILQFYTLSVYFKIEMIDRIEGKALVVDRFGDPCGTLSLDGFEETTFFHSPDSFEMIVVSEMQENSWTHNELDLREIPILNSPHSDGYYNVLVLERSEGVAERRGIGLIWRDSIMRSLRPGPDWREILLA